MSDPTTIINQISLVSGIASILLAVVAIIYAFFQSYNSSKQSQIVNETLIKVSKVEELVSLRTEMISMKSDLSSQLTDVLSKIEDTKDALEEEVEIPEENKKDLNQKINSVKDSLNEMLLNSIHYDPPNTFSYHFYVTIKIDPKIESDEVFKHIRNAMATTATQIKPYKLGVGNFKVDGEIVTLTLKAYGGNTEVFEGILINTFQKNLSDSLELISMHRYA